MIELWNKGEETTHTKGNGMGTCRADIPLGKDVRCASHLISSWRRSE